MQSFRPETLEAITGTYYVYALLDPRSSSKHIFYVGKGTGNRCFSHARGEKVDIGVMNLKRDMIHEIKGSVGLPSIEIIASGLEEKDAFRLESIIIGSMPHLTNAVRGHRADSYWVPAKDFDQRYANPLLRDLLPRKTMLVSLNGGRDLTPWPVFKNDEAQVAQRTLGDWRASAMRARDVPMVLGSTKG